MGPEFLIGNLKGEIKVVRQTNPEFRVVTNFSSNLNHNFMISV